MLNTLYLCNLGIDKNETQLGMYGFKYSLECKIYCTLVDRRANQCIRLTNIFNGTWGIEIK